MLNNSALGQRLQSAEKKAYTAFVTGGSSSTPKPTTSAPVTPVPATSAPETPTQQNANAPAVQPPLKKAKTYIAPKTSTAAASIVQGNDPVKGTNANQLARFEDFLKHVDLNFTAFKEQLATGNVDSDIIHQAFDEATKLSQVILIPDNAIPQRNSVIDGQEKNVPNKGTYKEGFRDNANNIAEQDWSKYHVNTNDIINSKLFDFNLEKANLKDISVSVAKLAGAKAVQGAGLAVLGSEATTVAYGTGLLANGGITAAINSGLASAGVGELGILVTQMGIEGSLAGLGVSAGTVGAIAGGAVIIAGMVMAGIAAYGIYKGLGGKYEFSFTDLFGGNKKQEDQA